VLAVIMIKKREKGSFAWEDEEIIIWELSRRQGY
jgi:hypothetical protein